MARSSDRDVKPRNGHTLRVGVGCRFSGCANQKEQSLQDQEDNGKKVIAGMYDGPVEYIIISTKGKGEALDRPELEEIERLYRRGNLDLFIWEDLGRLVRVLRPFGCLASASTMAFVYESRVFSVDQSTGTASSDSLRTWAWYDKRGNLIKSDQPGGLVSKSQYDGARRVISRVAKFWSRWRTRMTSTATSS